MEGLLYQAQTQIWDVIDEISTYERKKRVTQVELALISLGNPLLPEENGYMRIHSNFTSDRQALADQLFLLTANGGEEYFTRAVVKAVDSLEWREKASYKAIIVAGNERFQQGKVGLDHMFNSLNKTGIYLNTVYCGNEDQGIEHGWNLTTQAKNGAFTNIPIKAYANKETPFDKQIVRLYKQYLDSYGDSISLKRIEALPRQKVSPAYRDLLLNRFKKEPMPADLIDRFEASDWNFEAITPEEWPPSLQQLSEREKKEFLVKKTQERNNARDGIRVYHQKINELLNIKQEAAPEDAIELKDALIEIIRKQLKEKGFRPKK